MFKHNSKFALKIEKFYFFLDYWKQKPQTLARKTAFLEKPVYKAHPMVSLEQIGIQKIEQSAAKIEKHELFLYKNAKFFPRKGNFWGKIVTLSIDFASMSHLIIDFCE